MIIDKKCQIWYFVTNMKSAWGCSAMVKKMKSQVKSLLYGTVLAAAAFTPKIGAAAPNAASSDNGDNKPQTELTIDYKKMPSASIAAELTDDEWHKLLDGVIKYSKNDNGRS